MIGVLLAIGVAAATAAVLMLAVGLGWLSSNDGRDPEEDERKERRRRLNVRPHDRDQWAPEEWVG